MDYEYTSECFRVSDSILMSELKEACEKVDIKFKKINKRLYNFYYKDESKMNWLIAVLLLKPYPKFISGKNKIKLKQTIK